MPTTAIPAWITTPATWVVDHREPITLAVGAIALLAGVVAAWRWWRTGQRHQRVGTLAFAMGTALALEGMYEVGTGSLNLHAVLALGLCSLFEVVLIHQYLYAKHRLDLGLPVGQQIRMIRAAAAASGFVASLAADNIAEFALRLVVPAFVAALWTMEFAHESIDEDRTQWAWTPRRIGLRLGMIRPGRDDAQTVDRDYRTAQLTTLEYRRRHGWSKLAGRRATKLARLSLDADDAMIAEVRDRVARASWFTQPARAPRTLPTICGRDWPRTLTVPSRIPRTPAPAQPAARIEVPTIVLPRTGTGWPAHPAAQPVAHPVARTNGHPVARANGAPARTPRARDLRPTTTKPRTPSRTTVAHPRTPDDLPQRVRDYKAAHPDASARAIARELGCSDSTVRTHLKEMP